MEMDDFIRYFSKVELCNLQTARIDDDDDAQMNWVTTIHEVNKEIDCLELYHERLIKFGPLTKKRNKIKQITTIATLIVEIHFFSRQTHMLLLTTI